MAKNPVWGSILAYLAQIWVTITFFRNLVPSVTRSQVQLSSCTISETNNDPILRKLSDGQSARVFCPTNVERRKDVKSQEVSL